MKSFIISFFPSPYFWSFALIIFLAAKIHAFRDYESEKLIGSDVNHYYLYLPAAFIYKDLSLSYADTQPAQVREHTWYITRSDGKRLIKTTSGVAIFLAPMFFVAHAFSETLGYEANGYSLLYKLSIAASAIIFSFFTMLLLIRILRRYVKDWIISFLLVILFAGTNLFIYVTTEPGMSHVYSLFLFASFVYLTPKWHDKPSPQLSMILGLAFGMIVLVRPSNGVILLFFLLYGIKDRSTINSKLQLLARSPRMIMLFLTCSIIPWIPQIAYWTYLTGEPFVFSYHPGERFFFLKPRIIEGLFSFRKGWLLYTPVMAFALIGIAQLKKKAPELFIPVLTFTLINLYVVFSWWCWWYGGSFSQRALIESYAILVIPFAILLDTIFRKRNYVMSVSIATIILGLSYLNQVQSQQYRIALLHWDSMSKEAYIKGFGKLKTPEGFEKYYEPIDYEAAMRGEKKIIN